MAMRRRLIVISISVLVILLIGGFSWYFLHKPPAVTSPFDGQRAFLDAETQMAFGPRTVGSQSHAETVNYIQNELKKAHWQTTIQKSSWKDVPIENIMATRGKQTPEIILGAHYDSREAADQDPGPGPYPPVPGANDGASGVAVLLELARTLPTNTAPIELVFFDAEDNGGLNGQDWLLGSRAFVAGLTFHPQAVVVLDMIGDADLNIYIERNSNPTLVAEIWKQAAEMGHQQQFIPTEKWNMEDDHTPFLEAGIPAVDIIDFDYPYWHTSEDTIDKISATSLQTVGEVVRAWIMTQK